MTARKYEARLRKLEEAPVKKTGNNLPGPGPGRPKGVPNKATAAIKDAIIEAFNKVGGADYLLTVAQTDPKTFCQLIGKVIPLQVDATGLTIMIARDDSRV